MTWVMAGGEAAFYAGAMEAKTCLDNRGLEPPLPMVRTLEAFERLAPGEVLEIHNDRVPIYLFPQLEERGASYEVLERPDGSAVVTITKTVTGAATSPGSSPL